MLTSLMTPESSDLTRISWRIKDMEAARREMVKQLFILLDLVVLRDLAGRRQIRVRRRPIVETARRTWARIVWEVA